MCTDGHSKYLEQVKFYTYLGSILYGDKFIEERIAERIALGNKAYDANQKTFKSKLVSKRAKLKLYWAIIRPLITYASETWVLKESKKRKFIIPERKILTHSLP